MIYVEVILPLAVPGTFTYHAEESKSKLLITGVRVVVSFGRGKLYTGIVHHIHQTKPEKYKTKAISAILDDQPLVTFSQIKFWEWISAYYCCTLGEVYRNAFPNALRLESESYISLVKSEAAILNDLSDQAYLIYEALQLKQTLSVKEAAKIIDSKSAISRIKELFDFGLIQMQEKLQEKYKAKSQYFIHIPEEVLNNQSFMNEKIEELKRAYKQRETFLQLVSEQIKANKPIKASEFIKKFGGNYSVFRSLEQRGLILLEERQFGRILQDDIDTNKIPELSFAQKTAFQKINNGWEEKSTVLFNGVTSSGKTEIYIHLIEEAISDNKKVLYLLPEIGLTTQLLGRLKRYFGNKVGVYHSKFNQNERVELWNKTLKGDYDIIIGPRSSIFLPFPKLDLVIIDEEHESSFKQQDKKPYFQARDTALVLAHQLNAKTILGSATPSLESFYNAQQNKYAYVELNERFGNIQPPKVQLIDLKKALKDKEINGNISNWVKDAIDQQFKLNKQIIVFQNRRGFAPILSCTNCGFTSNCPNCSVSLTYHKFKAQIKCHYCGYKEYKPKRCPQCQSLELTTKGIGTEQIAEELQTMCPNKVIARMDQDSMRKKHAYEKTLEAFENQEIDILVGTQMITKGLDFSNVSLVVVIRADAMLFYPSFRTSEQAFQQLSQVAGRAGRRKERGLVLIQSFNPEHFVLQHVSTLTYSNFIKEVLQERRQFNYPPFCKVILIEFKHKSQERVFKTAHQFAQLVQPFLKPEQLLGPEPAAIERVRNHYIFNLMIKIEENQSPKKIKEIINQQLERLQTVSAFRSVQIKIDVDPN